MKKKQIITFILLLIIGVVVAQTKYNTKGKVALKGYDPVSYVKYKKAQKGEKKWSIIHEGATFYFASENNLKLFKANPSYYLPQYGGWCAYAMGLDGTKVDINPKTFKVIDGKLYLFYNKFGTNTLELWNEDEVNLKEKADVNWQKK